MAVAQVKYLTGSFLGKKKTVNVTEIKPALKGLHFDPTAKYFVNSDKVRIIFIAGKLLSLKIYVCDVPCVKVTVIIHVPTNLYVCVLLNYRN